MLAAIPSVLVFLDRWLARPLDLAVLYLIWDSLLAGRFCPWPSYFVIALPAALAATVCVYRWPRGQPLLQLPRPASPCVAPRPVEGQRRAAQAVILVSGGAMAAVLVRSHLGGARPGWEYAVPFAVFLLGWLLIELPLPRPPALAKMLGRPAWMRLGAHVLLIGALTTGYLRHPLAPVLGAAAVLAHGLLWIKRRRSTPPAFWLVSLALLVCCVYIDAWWFAAIGDEYAFYDLASMVLHGRPGASISSMLYNPIAVYGSHPGGSVLLQAASLALLGDNVFGWRFGGIYLAAISLVPLYAFFRSLGRPRLAWFACVLLAVSHYLMAFGKIGYNNLQALFAFSVALGAAAWVVRTRRLAASVACGLSLALAVYVFPAALLTLPVPLLYLGSFDPPRRDSLGRWLALAIVFAAATLPMLVQPDWWTTKAAGTIWNNSAIVAGWHTAADHIFSNLAFASLSFLFAPLESHFVAVGYLDVLSSLFVLLGLGALLRQGSTRPGRFVLASLALLLLLVGALHDYVVPTTTRMFLLLPWFALLGGMGMLWLDQALRDLGASTRRIHLCTSLVVLALLGLNLLQAYPLSRLRMAERYQSAQVILQREAQVLLHPDPRALKLVIVTTSEGPLRNALLRQLRLHRTPHDPRSILEVRADTVPEEVVADDQAVILITDSVPEETLAAIESRLQAAGKRACRFRNSLGQVRLVVWLAPQERGRCAAAPIGW